MQADVPRCDDVNGLEANQGTFAGLQDKTRQDMTRHDKTRQNKTRQQTRQDSRQDKAADKARQQTRQGRRKQGERERESDIQIKGREPVGWEQKYSESLECKILIGRQRAWPLSSPSFQQ